MCNKLIIALVFFFVISPVSAQNQQVELYLKQVEQGNYQGVQSALPDLVSQYPDHPGVQYLQGIMEKDGEKAQRIFKKIADDSPDNSYTDDAIMQVAEYLFAKGLYITAEKYLRRIPVQHARSPHLERAANMMINSMNAAGKIDSSRIWKRVLAQQFPRIEFDQSSASETTAKGGSGSETGSEGTTRVDLGDRGNGDKDTQSGSQGGINKPYVLQVGAFSTMENALREKDLLESHGYDVEIRKRERNNVQLYLVWVGGYSTREDAEQAGEVIKRRADVSYFVVELGQ